jgi:hypothetical protein
MDLGKWLRDRKKQAGAVIAQANPFDNGKTYNTVTKNIELGPPKPQQQPVQNQARQPIQVDNNTTEYFKRNNFDLPSFVNNQKVYDQFKSSTNYDKLSKREQAQLQSKIPQEARDYESRKKQYEKLASSYKDYTANAPDKKQSGVQQATRNFISGGATETARAPGNARTVFGSVLDLLSPEGSHVDKFAQKQYNAGGKQVKQAEQKIVDTGYGSNPNDNRFIAGTASAGGSLVNSLATGNIAKPFTIAQMSTNIVGDTTRDVRDRGGSNTRGLVTGVFSAAPQAMLEKTNLDKLLGGFGGNFVKRGVQGVATEGGTEGAQQLFSNIAKRTYDPNQKLTEGVAESALYGGLAGGAAGVALPAPNVQTNVKQKEVVQKEVVEKVQTAPQDVQQAIQSPDPIVRQTAQDQVLSQGLPKVIEMPTIEAMRERMRIAKENISKPLVEPPNRSTFLEDQTSPLNEDNLVKLPEQTPLQEQVAPQQSELDKTNQLTQEKVMLEQSLMQGVNPDQQALIEQRLAEVNSELGQQNKSGVNLSNRVLDGFKRLKETAKNLTALDQNGYIKNPYGPNPEQVNDQLYHGTKNADDIIRDGFREMPPQHGSASNMHGRGTYLTNNKLRAGDYIGENGKVLNVEIPKDAKIYKPKNQMDEVFGKDTKYGDPDLITEKFRKLGYDGLQIGDGPNKDVIVFDSKKVSIANKRSLKDNQDGKIKNPFSRNKSQLSSKDLQARNKAVVGYNEAIAKNKKASAKRYSDEIKKIDNQDGSVQIPTPIVKLADRINSRKKLNEVGGAKAGDIPGINKAAKDKSPLDFSKIEVQHPQTKKAIDYLTNNFDKAYSDYKAKVLKDFGTEKVAAGDAAKYTVPGFEDNIANSTYFHEPTSLLAKYHLKQLLADPTTKDLPVIITAGGTGAGKTYGLTTLNSNLGKDYAAVIDTNLATISSVEKRIKQIKDSGRKIEINFVYRDPVDAFVNGVLPRAVEEKRAVTTSVHTDMHVDALRTLARTMNKYKNDPDVEIRVIKNDGVNKPVLIDAEAVYKLNQTRYNKNVLKGELNEKLEQAYKNGDITEEIYKASKIRLGNTSGQNNTGNDRRNVQRVTTTPGISQRPEAGNIRPAQQTKLTRVTPAEAEAVLDRDIPAKNKNGDCYQAAYRYATSNTQNKPTVVHGMVTGQGVLKGIKYDHAWVEEGDTVIDKSNGQDIRIPKEAYYALGDIQENQTIRYSVNDVFKYAEETGTYGKWPKPKKSLFKPLDSEGKVPMDSPLLPFSRLTKDKKGKSGFIKTMQKSNEISPALQSKLAKTETTYDRVTNKEQTEKAESFVNKGLFKAVAKVNLDIDSKNFNDQNVADAIAVIKRLDRKPSETNLQLSTDLSEKLSKALSKAGQTVQAAAVLNSHTPEGTKFRAEKLLRKNKIEITPEIQKALAVATEDVRQAQKEVQKAEKQVAKAEKQSVKTGTRKDVIAAKQDLKDAREAEAYSRFLIMHEVNQHLKSPTSERLVNTWRAGLLTAPTTTGGAFIGNIDNLATRKLWTNPIAYIADGVMSLRTGKRTAALAQRGQFGIGAKGAGGNVTSKRYWQTGYDAMQTMENAGKYDQPNRRMNFGNSKFAKANAGYVNGVYGLMGAVDQPYRYGAFQESLSSQAKSEAITRKLTGQQRTEFIEEFMVDPPAKAQDKAVKEARFATFQDETALGTGILAIKQKFKQKGWKSASAFMDFMIPFAGVPSSVATRIVKRTPLGIASELSKQIVEMKKGGEFDQRAMSQAIGEGTAAIPVIAAGFALAANGLLTGGYPEEDKDRKQWEIEGKQPNSIRVGDRWYSLNYIQPFGAILNVGAGMYNTGKEDPDAVDRIISGVTTGTGSIKDQSYLQGLSSTLDMLDQGASSDYARERFLNSTAGSIVPNFVRSGVRAADDKQRQTNSPLDAVKSGLPKLRGTLETKKDMFGNDLPPKDTFLNQFINPLKPSKVQEGDATTQELSRLNNAKQGVFPTKVTKDALEGASEKQIKELDANTGKATKAIWDKIIATDGYKNLSDEDKNKVLTAAKKDVTAIEKRKYSADKELGEYAQGYDGKQTKLSTSQVELMNNGDANKYIKASDAKTLPKNINGLAREILDGEDTEDVNWNTKPASDKVKNTLTTWLPKGVTAPPFNNEVAKDWATMEKKRAEGTLGKLEEETTRKTILKKAYNSQLNEDERDLYSLSEAKLEDALKRGVITENNIKKALAVEKQLYAAGLIDKESLARKLGLAAGGYKGRKGSKGGKAKVDTSVADALQLQSKTLKELDALLNKTARFKSSGSGGKVAVNKPTLKKITVNMSSKGNNNV